MDDLSRRRALTVATAAGWLAGGGLLVKHTMSTADAAPQRSTVIAVGSEFAAKDIRSFKHRGRPVVIGENDKNFGISVDGRRLSHHSAHRMEPGRYSSMDLPYAEYNDPAALARELVDGDGVLFKL